MKVKSESEVAQSCPTLRDRMDCSPPGSSIHGIFQARVLEWVAIAVSSFCSGNQQFKVFFSVQGRFLFSLSGVFFLPSLCMIHSFPLGEIFAQCQLLWDSILYQFIKPPFCILLFCAFFFFGFYYICIGLGFCLCHPPECMLCERATLSYLFSYP